MTGNKAHMIADKAKLDYMSALDFPNVLTTPPPDTSLTTPPSDTSLTTLPPGNDPATPLPPKQNILKRPQPLLDIYEMGTMEVRCHNQQY